MKIALDEFLFTADVKTGIGWNQEYITKELSKRDDVDIILNAYPHPFSKRAKHIFEDYKKNGTKLRKAFMIPHYVLAYCAENVGYPYRWIFPKKTDITLFFNYFVPKRVGTKTAVYVCDVNYKVFPETTRTDIYDWLEAKLPIFCERADLVITISEFSKREIIKYLNIPEEKIAVVPCGIDLSVYHPNYSIEDKEKVKKKYVIPGEYILYLGTLEPRKNIPVLIEAYSQLINEGNDTHIPYLVLAGMKGWSYDEIFEKVKSLGLEERVVFTGYVDKEDAPILMAGAEFFVFPSKYEGFGIPPLEAMACGTPVIVSDAASLPEVVGDAGLYAKVDDAESLKEKMKTLLENVDLRKKFSGKAIERSREFAWNKVTDDLLQKMLMLM